VRRPFFRRTLLLFYQIVNTPYLYDIRPLLLLICNMVNPIHFDFIQLMNLFIWQYFFIHMLRSGSINPRRKRYILNFFLIFHGDVTRLCYNYSLNLVISGIIGRTVVVAIVLQYCRLIRSANISTMLCKSAIDKTN